MTPHHAAARSLAARLLGSLDDAEDAVQDALLTTYRSLDALPGRAPFRPWFLRVVYNRCIDLMRRRATRARHEAALPARLAPSAAERSADRETLARVRAAMDALPEKQRAALHLRVYEDLSYDEIGRIVGLTPASARVYVVRARAALRERLA